MNVLYVCKAVDESSAVLANQVRWIRALAERDEVDEVRVMTPRLGNAQLPANVSVHVFGARPPLQVLRASLRFYRRLARAGPGADLAFVAQGGHYPALLLPWKLMARRPLYQWKAMPHVSARMRFYVRYCDDLVFTATPGSFPMRLDKVRVVGHGIDTDLFRPQVRQNGAHRRVPTRDLVVVTRIAPVKRLDQMVRALAEYQRRFGKAPTLDIIGPCDTKSQEHRRALLAMVDELGLAESVRLLGSVEQHRLPSMLAGYRATLNFAETAFDKAAGEAMACGLPVVTSNFRVVEVLPDDMHPQLVVPADDASAQANAIHEVLSWDGGARTEVGARLRHVILKDHSLHALFGKILAAVEADRR